MMANDSFDELYRDYLDLVSLLEADCAANPEAWEIAEWHHEATTTGALAPDRARLYRDGHPPV